MIGFFPRIGLIALAAGIAWSSGARAQAPVDQSFLSAFPQLEPYVYKEPSAGFYLGLGISPVGILGSSMIFTANFFELHWIKDNYDIEILNASYAFTRAQDSEFQSTHFTFRTAPKYHLIGPLSAGVVLGYEYVTFPSVGARIFQSGTGKIEPASEPFSSGGWIYGIVASETFKIAGGENLFKVSELAYQESYSATHTSRGWTYVFDDQTLQQDTTKISAGTVLMIEASFLY